MEIKYVPLKLLVKKVKVGFVGSIDSFYCQKNDGYPLLRTLNLTGTGIDYSDLKYVTKEFFDKNKKSQLHKGDILIARHGDNGKADIFNESFEAQALNVVIIEPDNTKASSNLIKYYFDMPFVKKQIENLTNGSVQGVINTEQIADLKIPIIETLNYNKTINILMNIDNQIKRNNDMVQKLQYYRPTISCFSKKGEMRYVA